MKKSTPSPMEVTQLLQAWPDDAKHTLDKLLPMIYREIHSIAARLFANEPDDHTWDGTVLVNEFYLSLTDGLAIQWVNRQQFFAFAANKMRHLLIDKARERRATKRGGGMQPVTLTSLANLDLQAAKQVDILDLDQALQRMAVVDESLVKVIELRYFAGLSIAEIAKVQEMGERSVSRKWSAARAWLHKALLDQGINRQE